MTNQLVGDVYQKIIEEVVQASSTDFEESAVPSSTLQELQQEWQSKLSQRNVAHMPWDPKPQPIQSPPQPAQSMPSAASANGMAPSGYPSYDSSHPPAPNGGPRIKTDPGSEPQYHGLPSTYHPANPVPTQGGIARAQQLVQQNFGQAANASLNAMQQRGGLALPGQNVKPPPPGVQMPSAEAQRAYQFHQQVAAQHNQQQQPFPANYAPRIKTENESPTVTQGTFDQKRPQQTYGHDGADDALEEWRAQLAQRRAQAAEQTSHADRMMHDRVMHLSQQLQSGLLLPLDEQPSRNKKARRSPPSSSVVVASSSSSSSSHPPAIPQFDGDYDEDEQKPDIKEEDDENAINSDLDDPDDDGHGAMGDDDDDMGDSILCTYDKVQRVKNKWKCTLKDGVMSVNGKEWVFHKGTGEFEW